MPNKATWTVLTYIAAHNNLDQFGKASLTEILNLGSSKDVVLGALYDGTFGAARYVIGDPGFVESQEQLGNFDSGDADGVIDTAKWLFEKYPAEHYALVLWSHGSGWEPSEIEAVANEARPGDHADTQEFQERAAMPGSRSLFRSTLREILKPERPAERAILFDDGTGHSLDTLELARVTGAIERSVGQPLELLGMDACLMANLEVAYEVRKSVRYLVASEELVPGHSWPYRQIFGALRANPIKGDKFARLIVKSYVDFYTANPPAAGDVTKIALDLSQIEGLVEPVDQLAGALRDDMSRNADALWKSQWTARDQETRGGNRTQSKFDYYLWDIGSIAAGLAASAAASNEVRQKALIASEALRSGKGAILAEGHRGAWFDGTSGLSTYLMPPKQQRISPSYSKLAFAKDTQWDEMLFAYHKYFD